MSSATIDRERASRVAGWTGFPLDRSGRRAGLSAGRRDRSLLALVFGRRSGSSVESVDVGLHVFLFGRLNSIHDISNRIITASNLIITP
jgi:hypothetical protein